MEWNFNKFLNDAVVTYSEKPFVYTLSIVVLGLVTHRIVHWLFVEDEDSTFDNNLEESLLRDMIIPNKCLRWRKMNLSGKWHTSLAAIVNPPKLDQWKPVLVFANRKSGSNQGEEILNQCRALLNPIQVHDLSSKPPHATLEICRLLPDTSFLILVCGGDGSVSWVLSAIEEMDLLLTPMVSVLPLGTGNDLSIMLGWGSCFGSTDTVENFLTQLRYAQPLQVDRWRITIDPHRSYLGWKRRGRQFSMLNYFSIGCDALLALNFHKQRRKKPSLFVSRSMNKLFYFGYGAKDVLEQHCKHLNKHLQVWLDDKRVDLPELEGILFLNISSWGGGCKVWDNFSNGDVEWGYSDPSDNMFEVIGFSSSFHMAQIQVNMAEPIRIGQAKSVKIILTTQVPAQVDGEPWELDPCNIDIKFNEKATLLCKEQDDVSEDTDILLLETN